MASSALLTVGEAAHVAGMVRQQQIFRHVEDEQRAHAVIREALPHLGGEQEGEAARMAEQLRASAFGGDGRAMWTRSATGVHPLHPAQWPGSPDAPGTSSDAPTALAYPQAPVITGSSGFADDDNNRAVMRTEEPLLSALIVLVLASVCIDRAGARPPSRPCCTSTPSRPRARCRSMWRSIRASSPGTA